MIVTAQDFRSSPYKIPNLDDEEILADFNAFVEYEEQEVLRRALGPNLYTDYLAGLQINPVDVKWTRLKDGYEYQYGTFKYNYIGLKKILTPYIYAMWVRDHIHSFAGDAIVEPKFQNAEKANPAYKIVMAYNKFVDLIGHKYSISDPSVQLVNPYPNTLYTYLKVHEADYPMLYFRGFEKMNLFNFL